MDALTACIFVALALVVSLCTLLAVTLGAVLAMRVRSGKPPVPSRAELGEFLRRPAATPPADAPANRYPTPKP